MITFSNLGKEETWGRLGNQLFQIAATISHAFKTETDFCFPAWKYAKYFKYNLPQDENIKSKFTADDVYPHQNFHYTPLPVPNDKQLDISGWFQSEKYFLPAKEQVLEQFLFSDEVMDKAKHHISTLTPTGQTENNIAIHVRRGDYLQKQAHHPTQSLNWYKMAVNRMERELKQPLNIVVFSDDINFIIDNFTEKNFPNANRITWITPGNEIIDLALMSLCNHHIICNSTYSWWGAYLAQNYNQQQSIPQVVIAPRRWFGDKVNLITDDIYCPNWIKL